MCYFIISVPVHHLRRDDSHTKLVHTKPDAKIDTRLAYIYRVADWLIRRRCNMCWYYIAPMSLKPIIEHRLTLSQVFDKRTSTCLVVLCLCFSFVNAKFRLFLLAIASYCIQKSFLQVDYFLLFTLYYSVLFVVVVVGAATAALRGMEKYGFRDKNQRTGFIWRWNFTVSVRDSGGRLLKCEDPKGCSVIPFVLVCDRELFIKIVCIFIRGWNPQWNTKRGPSINVRGFWWFVVNFKPNANRG